MYAHYTTYITLGIIFPNFAKTDGTSNLHLTSESLQKLLNVGIKNLVTNLVASK